MRIMTLNTRGFCYKTLTIRRIQRARRGTCSSGTAFRWFQRLTRTITSLTSSPQDNTNNRLKGFIIHSQSQTCPPGQPSSDGSTTRSSTPSLSRLRMGTMSQEILNCLSPKTRSCRSTKKQSIRMLFRTTLLLVSRRS